MKKNIFILLLLFFFGACTTGTRTKRNESIISKKDVFDSKSKVGPGEDDSYLVSTSQIIDPAGVSVVFPGRPVDLALNAAGTILAVKNMQDIVFFNTETHIIIQTLRLPRGGSSFNGIGWTSDEDELWITDGRGSLRSISKGENNLYSWKKEFVLPGFDKQSSYPGGFAIDEKNKVIYVALNRNNTVAVVNLKTGTIERQIPVGVAPFTVVIAKGKAYVTNWGGHHPANGELTHKSSGTPVAIDKNTGVASSGTVSVISLPDQKVIKEINVGLHPCDMTLSPDNSLLYVTNSNSDNVSVIDIDADDVVRTISSKPVDDLPFGSAPDAAAVSNDGKTLFVANGGDNILAVYSLSEKKITGLIPTGWYPSAIELSKNGKMLYVANMKGIGSRNGNMREHGFNSQDQTGSVSFIPVPGYDSLESYTLRAAACMRLPRITQVMNLPKVKEKIVPVPEKPGEKSVFKHVIYIIKENRTYDQVLGDLPSGNGDSSLTMFGRKVTPNHHKLAKEFVLLDNTYCNGVMSAEGHNWTSQGYTTDYLEKSFPDWVRGYPWNGDDPLVYSPSGFIWDYVMKAGLIFRTYGEFVSDEVKPEGSTWTDIYNDYRSKTGKISIRAIPTIHTLEKSFCPEYTGSPRQINDQYKADVFIKELYAFEKTGNFPNLMMLSLPNNHTSGTQVGFPVPEAMVADNDLALGRIVEAVSNSKFWKETVIFVIEDDPQNGLDHVDGHRTIAFCISPYTKRGKVISTHYNQNSILRSIELILGLPAMTRFDLISLPMTDCFTSVPDLTPYKALPNNIPLDKMNPPLSVLSGEQLRWAKKSMQLQLEDNDDLDYDEEIMLNKILWYSVKGYDVPYPGTEKKQIN